MNLFPSEFERSANSVAEIAAHLTSLGVDAALLKLLPKNANDKNQIYVASDFGVLYGLFALTFSDRATSASRKDARTSGRRILEAAFNSFAWVRRDGSLIAAKRAKAIIYPQYPEARLSGFAAVDNSMPHSLSIAFTKANPTSKRLLVLGKLPGGRCVGIVYVDVNPALEAEIERLPGLDRSSVCKFLSFKTDDRLRLERLLAGIVDRNLLGCRLDNGGKTLPFNGTQVCGYTLEHALNIQPNSSSDGDLFGIELKTHTQKKVTLFTPEPDFGMYAADFNAFMRKYGYQDSSGDLRITGIHKANIRCAKSKLTLRVREYGEVNDVRVPLPYNPSTPLTAKMDGVEVILEDDTGAVAAGWSLERLMNCWGAKHNEAVYISATKEDTTDAGQIAAGYENLIRFSPRVMWCSETSAERMLKAICDGVIFLDPAPKLHATDPAKNKRRAQWRVNDIAEAARALYENVSYKDLRPTD